MRFSFVLVSLLYVGGALAAPILPRSFDASIQDLAEVRTQIDILKELAVAVIPQQGTAREGGELLSSVDSIGTALETAAIEILGTAFESSSDGTDVWRAARTLDGPTVGALKEVIDKADSFSASIGNIFPPSLVAGLRTLAQRARGLDLAMKPLVPADARSSVLALRVEDAIKNFLGVCQRLGIQCD